MSRHRIVRVQLFVLAIAFQLHLPSRGCHAEEEIRELGLLRGRDTIDDEQIDLGSSLYASEVTCTDYYPGPGNRRFVLALPDQNSRYDSAYIFSNTGTWDAIRLDGEFPYARYYSLNLYDPFTGLTLLNLTDREIEPLEGHTNPFRPGADRYAEKRSFSFFLIPEGSSAPVPEGISYVEIPQELEQISVLLRVYRADKGMSNGGGVPPADFTFLSLNGEADCPTINDIFRPNTETGASSEEPSVLEAAIDLLIFPENTITSRNTMLELQGNDIVFFRYGNSQYWENGDKAYATGAIINSGVSVVQIRAPTFEDTYQGSSIFQGGTQVRYWSACVGGLGISSVSNCLRDDQIALDENGIATLVIGTYQIADATREHGLTFLPRGVVLYPILFFRHLVSDPNFEGSFNNAPSVNGFNLTFEEMQIFDIQQFIGDYGPSGIHFNTNADYLQWLEER